MSDSLISFGLYLTYAMIAIATLAAIVFPILYFVQNPKSAKGALIGAGAVALVFGLSYALAGNELLASYVPYGITASTSKLVSAGLIALYALGLGSILAAVYAEVAKMFK